MEALSFLSCQILICCESIHQNLVFTLIRTTSSISHGKFNRLGQTSNRQKESQLPSVFLVQKCFTETRRVVSRTEAVIISRLYENDEDEICTPGSLRSARSESRAWNEVWDSVRHILAADEAGAFKVRKIYPTPMGLAKLKANCVGLRRIAETGWPRRNTPLLKGKQITYLKQARDRII